MPVPVIRPGQTHPAVVKLKQAVVKTLKAQNHDQLASAINPGSRTYGRTAVRAVKVIQQGKQLTADGIVGAKTWHVLGVNEPVVDPQPPALHGIPFEPGLIAIDGRWVDKPLGEQLLAQRKAGKWTGVVNSGYRPAWYQKRLWDEAVKKYGSEQAASKWVARPGTSRHGQKGGNGAADVSNGEQLDASSDRLYRPMSWEAWHMQLAGTRDMPELPPGEPRDMEVSDAELEKHGVSKADIDESIQEVLHQIEHPDEELSEPDGGYDPEAQRTREPEGVTG